MLKDPRFLVAVALASLVLFVATALTAVFVVATADKPCKTCPAVSAPGTDAAFPQGQCVCGQSCVCHPCTLRHYPPPAPARPFSTSCPYCRRSIVVQPTGQTGDTEPAPE